MTQEKAVELHHQISATHHHGPMRFSSITSIPRPYYIKAIHCGDSEVRVWCVAETPAEVTNAAREVWPRFDCSGAEPRLEPTVTLHSIFGGNERVFGTITKIAEGTSGIDGSLARDVEGDCHYEGWASAMDLAVVTESAAEITRLARKVWPDFSCPGAEPPVVVLQSQVQGVWPYVEVIALRPIGTGCVVTGIDDDGANARITTVLGMAGVIALCAEKGVPCCAKRSLSERVAERIDEQAGAEKPEPEPDVAELETSPPPALLLHGYDSGCAHTISQIYSIGPSSLFPGATRVVCNDTQVGRIDLQARESVEAVTILAQATWGTDEEFTRTCGPAVSPEEAKLKERVAELEKHVEELKDAHGQRVLERDEAHREAALWEGVHGTMREWREKAEAKYDALHAQLAARQDWRETEMCPVCNGYGRKPPFQGGWQPRGVCHHCRGTGRVVKATRGDSSPE